MLLSNLATGHETSTRQAVRATIAPTNDKSRCKPLAALLRDLTIIVKNGVI